MSSRTRTFAVRLLVVLAFAIAGAKLGNIVSPATLPGCLAAATAPSRAVTFGLGWGVVVGLLVASGDRRTTFRRSRPRNAPPATTPATSAERTV